jgi:hypothetical protein
MPWGLPALLHASAGEMLGKILVAHWEIKYWGCARGRIKSVLYDANTRTNSLNACLNTALACSLQRSRTFRETHCGILLHNPQDYVHLNRSEC